MYEMNKWKTPTPAFHWNMNTVIEVDQMSWKALSYLISVNNRARTVENMPIWFHNASIWWICFWLFSSHKHFYLNEIDPQLLLLFMHNTISKQIRVNWLSFFSTNDYTEFILSLKNKANLLNSCHLWQPDGNYSVT